jgi:hypothetical protein
MTLEETRRSGFKSQCPHSLYKTSIIKGKGEKNDQIQHEESKYFYYYISYLYPYGCYILPILGYQIWGMGECWYLFNNDFLCPLWDSGNHSHPL